MCHQNSEKGAVLVIYKTLFKVKFPYYSLVSYLFPHTVDLCLGLVAVSLCLSPHTGDLFSGLVGVSFCLSPHTATCFRVL